MKKLVCRFILYFHFLFFANLLYFFFFCENSWIDICECCWLVIFFFFFLLLPTSFLFGIFFVAVQKVISSRTIWQFGIAGALLLHSPKNCLFNCVYAYGKYRFCFWTTMRGMPNAMAVTQLALLRSPRCLNFTVAAAEWGSHNHNWPTPIVFPTCCPVFFSFSLRRGFDMAKVKLKTFPPPAHLPLCTLLLAPLLLCSSFFPIRILVWDTPSMWSIAQSPRPARNNNCLLHQLCTSSALPVAPPSNRTI